MKRFDKPNINRQVDNVTIALYFLRCVYSSSMEEMIASICTNFKAKCFNKTKIRNI